MKTIFFYIMCLLGILGAQTAATGSAFKSASLALGARSLALGNADLATGNVQNLADAMAATIFGTPGLEMGLSYLGQVGFFDGASFSALNRGDGHAFGLTVHLASAGADPLLPSVANPWGSLSATVGGAVGLSEWFKWPFRLAVGGSLTYAGETVSDTSLSALHGQIGVALALPGDRVFLTTRLSRLGQGFNQETLPLSFAVAGTVITPLGRSPFALASSLRLDLGADDTKGVSAGVEASFRKWLFVRVGGVWDLDATGTTTRSGLTAGAGVRVRDFQIDAAVRPYSLTGMDLLFTVQTTLPELQIRGPDEDLAAPILAQAREALMAGRLDEARSLVIAGLEKYPDHGELNQLFQFIAVQSMLRQRGAK